MDNINENCLIQNDFTSLSARHSVETSTTRLQDLNYDCLREIFLYLDMASQFALVQSSQQFENIILYDIWYPLYDTTLDISKDRSLARHKPDFQADFLNVILNQFTRIKGISMEIFQKYMNKTTTKDFPNITTLHIQNFGNIQTEHKSLHIQHLYKFPNLQELQMDKVCIELSLKDKDTLLALKTLILKHIKVINDARGNFFKIISASTLEKLSLETLRPDRISFRKFAEINKCQQLRELTISVYYLQDHRLLECILNLPCLRIFTLESKDNYYFSPKDHTTFYVILSEISHSHDKVVTGLQLNGMPEKNFYRCPYLRELRTLNWFVKKIFHRRLDGSVEWKSDVPQVITLFYDFVINNQNLDTLFVNNNIFHKKRMQRDVDFEENLQDFRRRMNHKRLNIVNSSRQINPNDRFAHLPEGCLRFFIAERDY